MKKFLVVSATGDGGVELHPMKEWLRQHPDQIPTGMDATMSTSHQLRHGLKKKGWTDQDIGTEVRMIQPGSESAAAISSVLGETDDLAADVEDLESLAEASFALEYQLRDFIAQNIESIPVNGKRLRLYVDATGKEGVEFSTAVGPIDILAVDKETSSYSS
jgi:hypothetical protein